VNALSRITVQYAKNFETLFDIDTRKIKLKKEEIQDLKGYLIDFARLYTPLIRPKFISINVTRKTPNNIPVELDRELFDIAFSNIIDNAIKYSFNPEDRLKYGFQPKPGSTEDEENVLLTAKVESDVVVIWISSYGIELTAEERRKLFEREFRGVSADDRSKGIGIGLYLTKEIIKMHGGAIELVPQTPTFNTVFKITLPTKIRNSG
jgi:signal transduction histidine kinase